MFQYDYPDNLPDVVLEMPYAGNNVDRTVFADPHFYMELQEIQSAECSNSYYQYIQGYMALTPQGVELAEYFFRQARRLIEDPELNADGFFDSDHLAWVEPPSSDCASRNRIMSDIIFDSLAADHGLRDATWTRADSHPLFTDVFRFRFRITSSSRRTGETREAWHFQLVNAAREQTVRLYADVLQHSPEAFVRRVVLHHNPVLTQGEVQLLQEFTWERPDCT
jgi:hypothetical protein